MVMEDGGVTNLLSSFMLPVTTFRHWRQFFSRIYQVACTFESTDTSIIMYF